MSEHAQLSPSGAERWMGCPGSAFMEQGLPDSTSSFAAEGTAAHALAERCLREELDAHDFNNLIIDVGSYKFVVDTAMAEAVQIYLDAVRQYAKGHQMMIEQRLPIEHITGEPGAKGTVDVGVITADALEIQVHDLKYGRGVRVDAKDNKQLLLYALGALHEHDLVSNFERVRLVIHQPRLNHLSEWVISVAELVAFGKHAKMRAALARGCLALGVDHAVDLVPSDDACRWCKAKANCPALRDEVLTTSVGTAPATTTELECVMDTRQVDAPSLQGTPEQWLAACLSKADLIEGWVKAVRAEAERRLHAGLSVPGFKLVEGKRGNRKWKHAAEAEEALRAMRLKVEEMYDFTLISPTTAEKLHKAGAIGPRQWPKLTELIGQGEGRPTVVVDSDKRDAIQISACDFEAVTE